MALVKCKECGAEENIHRNLAGLDSHYLLGLWQDFLI